MIKYSSIKPLLFKLDPETAHHLGEFVLKLPNICPQPFNFFLSSHFIADDILSQELFGRTFYNPIGLGAGFDKNATMIKGIQMKTCVGVSASATSRTIQLFRSSRLLSEMPVDRSPDQGKSASTGSGSNRYPCFVSTLMDHPLSHLPTTCCVPNRHLCKFRHRYRPSGLAI